VKLTKLLLPITCLMLAMPTIAQDKGNKPADKSAEKTTGKTMPGQKVQFKTNLGDFTVELDVKAAPKTVENFVKYVGDKHYDGTVFHRVIPTFMVQGGGFDKTMAEKPTRPPIPIESDNGLKNDKGTIAMARTADPNSATSQFFINVVDNDRLNKPSFDGWGYTVFGKVVSGMETIEKIRVVPTGSRPPHQNVPDPLVVIQSARLVK
jgi:peptidyl-prolyl cis-trans isomerase A (cyclophilin A)